MAVGPESISLGQRILLRFREAAVLHVSEMIFRVVLIFVKVNKEVLGQLESEGQQGVKGIEYLVVE